MQNALNEKNRSSREMKQRQREKKGSRGVKGKERRNVTMGERQTQRETRDRSGKLDEKGKRPCACVRACNVGGINDGIACVTSRTSAGRSSSAPPLENSGGTRRACVHACSPAGDCASPVHDLQSVSPRLVRENQ